MEFKSNPLLNYHPERYEKFDKLLAEHKDYLSKQKREPIILTLHSGEQLDGISWETTPLQILQKKSLDPDDYVVAKINDELWDLDRPLENSGDLSFLTFEDPEGRQVFWHSSAHVFGHAVEVVFPGTLLCVGPPTEKNFFYDAFIPPTKQNGSGDQSKRTFDEDSIRQMKIVVDKVTGGEFPFERMVARRSDIIDLFGYNKFKLEIINDKPEEEFFPVYRCGGLVDMCRGPHVRHTGKVFHNMVVNSSSTFWKGDAANESLQRLYGISFPSQAQLEKHVTALENAQKYDHRNVGKQQELFFFHPLTPGSCFFLPKGAIIYRRLMAFLQGEYLKRGFKEVVTPNVFSAKLWETSGHWQHYSDNMFKFDCDNTQFGLKPMNCPGHCLMFNFRTRSYRELPLRLADFGVLHRNEISGALSGLTRVRRFQQDDAHIFCEASQIESEIIGCIDFLQFVYNRLGFKADFFLSTRPDDFIGEIAVWDSAEEQLKSALEKSGIKYTLNPKDGAFYGPKIDVCVSDVMDRPHQCGTIQLDFNLPERFNLLYTSDDQTEKRPVMIHRAIMGSLERMIGVLCEHVLGKWPFWLSPFQAVVMSVSAEANEYADEVRGVIEAAGFCCDLDSDPTTTLGKKIKNAQKYNFILVVGGNEVRDRTVSIRPREESHKNGVMPLEQVLDMFAQLAK